MTEIIFWGGSRYSEAVFKSLQKFCNKIYILPYALDIIGRLRRPCDEIINNVDDVDCNTIFFCDINNDKAKRISTEKEVFAIHESLLPNYRGSDPIFWAVMNGETVLGVTVYKLNMYMDAGDVLFQKIIPYQKSLLINEIYNGIENILEEYLATYLSGYLQGRFSLYPQNTVGISYTCKLDYEKDFLVDFYMSNTLLRRFFYIAKEPYPYPCIKIKDDLYEVLSYKIIDMKYVCMVGRVVNIDDQGVWIKTADGYLIINQVRRKKDNKKFKCRELMGIGYRFEKLERSIYE